MVTVATDISLDGLIPHLGWKSWALLTMHLTEVCIGGHNELGMQTRPHELNLVKVKSEKLASCEGWKSIQKVCKPLSLLIKCSSQVQHIICNRFGLATSPSLHSNN